MTLAKHRVLARLIADWCLAQDDLSGFEISESVAGRGIYVTLSFPWDRKAGVMFAADVGQNHFTSDAINRKLNELADESRGRKPKNWGAHVLDWPPCLMESK